MKAIEIVSLKLANFKGIKDFELEVSPGTTIIRGDNGSGKTTLKDAWLWLLFGRDSQGKADFAVKPLDTDGAEVHHLDSTVEAMLKVDGQLLTLQKVYSENWTRKRGQTTRAMTGHKTDHYIDGVPVKRSEYLVKVGTLVDEEIFKLLSNPYHFPSIPWTKQRDILMDIAGDIDDTDIKKDLVEILGNRTADDHKKVIAGRKKEINKRLEGIGPRIDELSNQMKGVKGDPEQLKEEIKALEEEIQSTSMPAYGYIKAKIRAAKEERRLMVKDADRAGSDAAASWSKGHQALKDKLQTLESKMRSLRDQRSLRDDICKAEATILAQLDDREADINAGDGCSVETECPACNQKLPEDQVAAAIDAFKLSISRSLEAVARQRGKHTALQEKAVDELRETNVEIKGVQDELTMRKAKYDAEIKARPNFSKTVDTTAKDAEILALELSLDDETPPKTDKLRRAVDELRHKLAAIDQAHSCADRIMELENEEKVLGVEFEELERQLHLIEEYTRAKVALVEERINGKFEIARFKLFNEQINGGLDDCCEVMVGGVPYHTGLNHAAQINVGLDIIATLSGHYSVEAPVWIDNAEAATRLLDIHAQTIKLVVDGDYDEMTAMDG